MVLPSREDEPMRNARNRTESFVRSLLGGALLLGLFFGCTQPEPVTSIKPLDQGVVTAVRANLQTDPELAAAGLQVEAHNHELVLKGTVSSQEAKERAESLARRVDRVQEVENQLEVVPQESPF